MEEFNPMVVDDDDEDKWEDDNLGFGHFGQTQSMPCADHVTMVCIVDRSGVHDLPVHWCRCPHHLSDDRQLFAMGLFPATFKLIKTAFTFHVLNDFRIENLECKTAALNFYNKLRRMTSNSFPDLVKVSLKPSEHPFHFVTGKWHQDRYEELMRVTRQWRDLKYRKWHGFAHTPDKEPGKGALALCCPTCPQPEVNIPNTWKEDPRRWLYTRSITMDGNFSADHIKMRNPGDDVNLADGTAFMVQDKDYRAHLRIAKEIREVTITRVSEIKNITKYV
jgi:hypothetical protein